MLFTDPHLLLNSHVSFRQKNHLQRLIQVLSEKSQVSLLSRFPFIGLEESTYQILSSLGRSQADVIKEPNYYNILYAIQFKKRDYKRGMT